MKKNPILRLVSSFLMLFSVHFFANAQGSIEQMIIDGNLNALKESIQQKEQVEVLKNDTQLLITAAQYCQPEIAKWLLSQGANLGKDLQKAAQKFNTELAYNFCGVGASDDAEDIASQKCSLEMMVLLIEGGVPVSDNTWYHLHCGFDVGSDWFKHMKPILVALFKRGLKVENARSIYDGTYSEEEEEEGKEVPYYLNDLCEYEKMFAEDDVYGRAAHQSIQAMILFFAENGTDFKKNLDSKVPYKLLSKATQKRLDTFYKKKK